MWNTQRHQYLNLQAETTTITRASLPEVEAINDADDAAPRERRR